jgi:hypothetical protein
VDDQRNARVMADVLASVLGGVFDALGEIVTTTERLLAGARLTRADLTALDPLAVRALQADDDLVIGAGYVAAPGVVADAKYWLQWWADYDIPRTGRPQPLQVELDPAAELFRDYTELPWFTVPAETGERHVTGPYVDYMCTDEYTFTFTIPVRAHGRFAGVVGADIHANDVEKLAYSRLVRLGSPVALLNSACRVVAAADSAYVAGDLVRGLPLAQALSEPGEQVACRDGSILYRLPELPFVLVVGPAVAD